jgi:hypothetical protein
MRLCLSLHLILQVVLCLVLCDLVASAGADDSEEEGLSDKATLATVLGGVLIAAFPPDFGESDSDESAREGKTHRLRARKQVRRIFDEHGPYYVRRAYRMDEASFWELLAMLKELLKRRPKKKKYGRTKKHKNGARNGLISCAIRLSCAIRYFAGGRPEDIAIVHWISHSEVFNSIWLVVDAVNSCDGLTFSFPASHAAQRELAAGFKERSKAGFDCCCGAMDGMLVWIERPTAFDCDMAQCGARKFFCGRKHKYGLNMQGTCDADGKFLDVSIQHPASTSDFLSYTTSKLSKKLETPGYLAKGLVIFGDSAYVNCSYFVTPYKSVKSGSKDDFNFYHSQVRIKIECAFGMLVARWGLLRRALPASIGLKKTTALVLCLCRLHNYCIDCRLGVARKKQCNSSVAPKERNRNSSDHDDIEQPLARDGPEVTGTGGVPLERLTFNEASPEQLLHGGHHFDDVSPQFRQNFTRQAMGISKDDPRELLRMKVLKQGICRPTPVEWHALNCDKYI